MTDGSELYADTFESDVAQKICSWLGQIGGTINRLNILVLLYAHEQHQGHERATSANFLTICAALLGIVRICNPVNLASANAGLFARSVYDTSLSGGYLLTDPKKLSADFELYALAYSISNQRLNKKLVNGKRIEVEHIFRTGKTTESEKAKNRFINAHGKLRPYTELSRKEQIEAIYRVDPQASLCFSTIEETVYGKLSEKVHGSYASFQFSQIERKLLGDLLYLEAEMITAFTVCCLSIEGFVRMFEKCHGESKLTEELKTKMRSWLYSLAETPPRSA